MPLPEGYHSWGEFAVDMALGLAFFVTLFVACALA